MTRTTKRYGEVTDESSKWERNSDGRAVFAVRKFASPWSRCADAFHVSNQFFCAGAAAIKFGVMMSSVAEMGAVDVAMTTLILAVHLATFSFLVAFSRDCCCFGCSCAYLRTYMHRGPYIERLQSGVIAATKEALDAQEGDSGDEQDTHAHELAVMNLVMAKLHAVMYLAVFPPEEGSTGADGEPGSVAVPLVLTKSQLRILDEYYGGGERTDSARMENIV